MAEYLVQDTSLTAVADAIRAKGGTSDTLAFPNGFVSAVEAISVGGRGGEAAELLYETTFTVDESQTGTSEVTLVTIETGLSDTVGSMREGDSLYLVIKCTNDTDPDTSYNHFRARTQNPVLTDGAYSSAQITSGVTRSDNGALYGSNYALYAKSLSRYAATITLATRGSSGFGFVPSGDYSLKLYRLIHAYFGLEGFYD